MSEIFQDPEFHSWLHELTTLGYKENIIVDTADAQLIEVYWKERLTPEQAVERYKKVLIRLNAIKEEEVSNES